MERDTGGWNLERAVRARCASRCECARPWCYHAGASQRCSLPLGPGDGRLVPKNPTGPPTPENSELLCASCSAGHLR